MVDEVQVWPTALRCFKSGSAHLTADTIEELHAFAKKLGLRPAWYQGCSRTGHYDLTPTKREKALTLGATFVPAKEQARKRIQAREQFETRGHETSSSSSRTIKGA